MNSAVLINDVCPAGLSVEVGVTTGKQWDRMFDFTRKEAER